MLSNEVGMLSHRRCGCNTFEERYVINPKVKKYKSCDLMTYRLQCKRITFRYRGLHTNPSDWIKIRQSEDCLIFWPARRDLNPRPSESESAAISSFATGGNIKSHNKT